MENTSSFASINDAITHAREASRASQEYEKARSTYNPEEVKECDRLSELEAVADDNVGAFPVTSIADLHIKSRFMAERFMFEQPGGDVWIRADIARLAGGRATWDNAFAVMAIAKAADDKINAYYTAADDAGKATMTAEWERLGDELSSASWPLVYIPAPDHAALLWKSEFLFGEAAHREGESPAWTGGVITLYMADVRRLLSTEGR